MQKTACNCIIIHWNNTTRGVAVTLRSGFRCITQIYISFRQNFWKNIQQWI